MKHVMIDLETLGTKPNAVFMSVAAIQFDLDTGQTFGELSLNVDLDDALRYGRDVEASTLQWWLTQKADTMKLMFENGYPMEPVLKRLSNFITFKDIKYVWGNSARFDLGILVHAYDSIAMPLPWDFRNERCYRTVNSLFEDSLEWLSLPSVPDAIKHYPLDDCRYQIKRLTEKWKTLTKKTDGQT